MVSIEGENMRPVTWCVSRKCSGDWGMGGNTHHDRVKNLRRRTAAV